jgi:Tol biopolymer transport system component
MQSRTLSAALLALILVCPSQSQDFRKLSELSKKGGWVFLAYSGFGNKTLYIRDGRVDLIYPKTNVVKELGLLVVSELGHQASPSLSPDGCCVAFVRRFSASVSDEAITTQNLDVGTNNDLTRSANQMYGLAWCPTGKEILFTTRGNYDYSFRPKICAVNVNDHRVSYLTSELSLEATSVSWSPNGKEFIVRGRLLDKSRAGSSWGMFIVNRETGKVRRIADGRDPSWSPNGQLIVYLDAEGRNCYTINPDGTNQQKMFSYKPIIPGGYQLMGPLLWSPDMRYLIYHKTAGRIGDQRTIYILDLKTKQKEEIFSGANLEIVDWGVRRR